MSSPTAFDLKLALMEYFRFKRQWVCVDECLNADIVADSGKCIVEVEVKVSRYDLLNGEAKKRNKHQNYEQQWYGYSIPNKYYFCVPADLRADAIEYAHKLNPKYGVIIYDSHTRDVLTVKSALMLHKEYKGKHSHQIAKRCSSKLVTLMQQERDRRANG
jgi:hypothetical protein